MGSLTPGQALVGIVNRELAATMGQGVSDIDLATQPPAVILMAGLQGAGKTTTTAKLAKHLIEKRKKKVLTVSGDVYRPAAIEQLRTVTKQAGAAWFPSQPDQKPHDIAAAAKKLADKVRAGDSFDLNDFLSQLSQMKKMGGLASLMDKLPTQMTAKAGQPDMDRAERDMRRMEGIINSMTPLERRKPDLL